MSNTITRENAGKLLPQPLMTHDTSVTTEHPREGQRPLKVTTVNKLMGLVFSPDGTLVVSYGDQVVKVWDVASQTLRATLEQPDFTGNVVRAMFLDAAALAVVGRSGAVHLWTLGPDAVTLQTTFTAPELTGGAFGVMRLKPSGVFGMKRLESGSLVVAYAPGEPGRYEPEIRIADLHTREILATLAHPEGEAWRTGQFFRGQFIATERGRNRGHYAWDCATWEPVDPPLGPDYGRMVGHSADESLLVATEKAMGMVDVEPLWILDAATGERVASFEMAFAIGAAFTPDNVLVAITTSRPVGGIDLRDVQTGELVQMVDGRYPAVFSPDGTRLACAKPKAGGTYFTFLAAGVPEPSRVSGGVGDVITADNCAQVREIAVLRGHSARINTLAISPDGQTLASGSNDRTLRLWDVATGAERALVRGHQAAINTVRFSADGQTVITASGDHGRSPDNTVRMWNAATGEPVCVLEGHPVRVNGADISPDGSQIASVDSYGRLRLWDAITGELQITQQHKAPANGVAYSPDGRVIAVAVGGETSPTEWNADNSVRLWTRGGAALGALERPKQWVLRVRFSPDGRWLFAVDIGRNLYGWVVDEVLAVGTARERPPGIVGDHVSAIAMRSLAAVANAKTRTIKLLDGSTGREITELAGHESRITDLAFDAAGRLLASASEDQTIRVWAVSPAG